jgi:hypothetical protein
MKARLERKNTRRIVAMPFRADEDHPVMCVQGNKASRYGTHNGPLRYAFDFDLSPGTEVFAADSGIVVAVEVSVANSC